MSSDTFSAEHIERWLQLASDAFTTKQYLEAKQYYLRILQCWPDAIPVLFNLGVICTKQGMVKEAMEFYFLLLSYQPYHHDTHHNLGVLYFKMRSREAAIYHLRLAIQGNRENTVAQYLLQVLTQPLLVQSAPIESIRQLFNEYAETYDQHLATLNNQLPMQLLSVVQSIPQSFFQCVLDAGCGTGSSGVLLRPYAKRLVGVDIAERMLTLAKQKAIYDVLHVSTIAAHLEKQIAAYDLIMVSDVLVYDGDLKSFFEHIARSLINNGWIVFNTEISDNEDYILTESGRFAHHDRYIQTVTQAVGLNTQRVVEITMRLQADQPLKGRIYLMTKSRYATNLR